MYASSKMAPSTHVLLIELLRLLAHNFEGRAVNAKIKTGINSHAPVLHMQSLWWVGVVYWH